MVNDCHSRKHVRLRCPHQEPQPGSASGPKWPTAALLDREQVHACVMGGSTGGAGLQGPRHDMAEGEVQGDELAREDKEHGR
jgi:hypothetical protein